MMPAEAAPAPGLVAPGAYRRRDLGGGCPYQPTVTAMHRRADAVSAGALGEVWFLEHAAVITLGKRAGRHLIHAPADIAIVETDRGGLVTWHGPGQLVIYPLIPVSIGVRDWVKLLLVTTAATLVKMGITEARADLATTGVYTSRGKIASLGIRVRGGVNRHGISINVELVPNGFRYIDPCGIVDQPIDQTAGWGVVSVALVADGWWGEFQQSYASG